MDAHIGINVIKTCRKVINTKLRPTVVLESDGAGWSWAGPSGSSALPGVTECYGWIMLDEYPGETALLVLLLLFQFSV